MASPPSPVPTSSPSPPSQGDMIPPPSSDPEPPISKSSTPTDPPAVSPPQSISAPPPFPSSSPPVSSPDVENPSSPPLSQSPPHSPPIAPASSVVPPPALAALLPPPSNPVEPPPMQPPPSPIPSDPPPVQPPPSSIIQTTPPSPSLPVSSPPPPPRLSHSTPSKSPGGSSPPSVEKSSPPPAHRKPTPPPSTLVPPTASGHQTPPPSSPQKPHLPTKSSPQPSFEPSSNSSAHKLVLPPSPSVQPPPVVPPSNFSISPIAPHPIPPDPLAPELFSSPRAQPGTPLDSLKPAATFPPNIAEEVASNRKQSRIKPGEAAGISVPIAFIILLVVSVAWFMRRKKNKEVNRGGYIMPTSIASSNASESNFPRSQTTPLVKASYGSNAYLHAPSEGVLGYSKSWFTFEELSDVTNGFSPHNILGKGGFGTVYKGRLSDGREVAVKQLKVGGGQGEREFQAEVEIISRIHHRHLVSLVGHCISENQRLLVYDFVPNNTLFYHLHGSGRPVLEWSMRIKVAAGSARGLAYLHEDCHPRIIHRDIKSSNILLDNNFEARVSDFGLAKLTVDAETHVSTRVMGTFGYMAPEYASSGKLTDKSDVYSFGVVLLELITGRKPVDPSQPLGDENLVEWARPLMTQVLETGDLGELPDPRLEKNYNSTDMFQMVEAAAACVRHSASMRPRMGLVMRALDNLTEVGDLHNGVKPGESELFHSIANSEEIRLFQRMAFGSQEYSNDVSRSSQLSQSHIDV